MLSGNSLLRLVYYTRQSKLTTNPKLIRFDLPHPELRQKVHKRSYRYDLTGDHVVNKHLYYDVKEASKEKTIKFLNRKAKQLDVRPFTGENIQIQRPFGEILSELFNKKLIQQQPSRAFSNIQEVLRVYPKQSQQNSNAVLWSLGELEKHVTLWGWKEFYSFCKYASNLGHVPTPSLFTTLYQHLYSAQALNKPVPLRQFAELVDYIFSVSPPAQVEKLMLKDTRPLELFKYNDPRPFSFQELLAKQYNEEYLRDHFGSKNSSQQRAKIAKSLQIFGGDLSARINGL